MKVTSLDQIEKLLPPKYIARSLHQRLSNHLKEPEVTILYGPRQVGKSSEIFLCIKELLSQENPPDIFYYNLDKPSPDFANVDSFSASILAQKQNSRLPTYVFLDEAPRLPDVGLFIKYLYDQKLGLKFVLTGSASLEIKQKTKESLTGRKQEFLLSPLSLQEILRFRGINVSKITGSFELLQKTLSDYLVFGGYPGVFALPGNSQKIDRLLEIANSYVLRDLSELFSLNNLTNTKIIASFLAENIGQILSFENLAKVSGASKYEVQKTVDALQKMYVLDMVPPFFRDKSKELSHRPKVYFTDLGIRNAILNRLNDTIITSGKGALFENAVFSELKTLCGAPQVKFWRNLNQTEVDFVVEKSFNQLEAFEAKYYWKGKNTTQSLASFKDKYPSLVNASSVIHKDNFWQLFKP